MLCSVAAPAAAQKEELTDYERDTVRFALKRHGAKIDPHPEGKRVAHIEIDVLGEPIGKQDQYAAAYGGLKHIRFQPDEQVFVDPVICPEGTLSRLEANLMAGDEVVAKAGSQVYGQVVKSVQAGRGIVVSHANLVLGLTDINIEGTMYPIQTGSFSEESTGIILQRKSVVIPAGSLLEFRLTQPLTVKK